MRSSPCLAWVFVVCMLTAPRTFAAVYRCAQNDGGISYQQIPCRLHSTPMQLDTGPSGWSALRPGERRLLEDYRRRDLPARRHRPTVRQETSGANAKTCWKKRRQLQAVRAHLHRGYKLAEADALRRKRDDYADYLREFCQ